jgi:hypothetical protein
LMTMSVTGYWTGNTAVDADHAQCVAHGGWRASTADAIAPRFEEIENRTCRFGRTAGQACWHDPDHGLGAIRRLSVLNSTLMSG